ncbi:hypothetical protein CP556_06570 [Natrinema sp. CBA1119]|uniref:hypothetical protein n=1 Tax=Natrinema sp. CBA1119 TaxID=1608465 RepID=UPI000BF891D3|nr:hypothetical protein [Natrinema sp. CBA1119]PGF15810.1 hypothetical protein CP556_06570 [Natrinema sp. CBA1119]
MSAQSPRLAQRAFTFLLAILLVGSMVAPIAAAGTASATTTTTAGTTSSLDVREDCGAAAKFAFPRSCHAAEMVFGSVDESQSADQIETDLHVSGQSVYESWESHDTVYQNYLQDTGTLASLEARNAIADAYENNESATAAQAAGQAAINDYYSTHEKSLLEIQAQHSARLWYLMNVSDNTSEIDNNFVHVWPFSGDVQSYGADGMATEQWTLSNGTTYDHQTLDVSYSTTADIPTLENKYEQYNPEQDRWKFEKSGNMNGASWNGGVGVMNAPAASLPPETVYDFRLVADRLYELREQADTVQSNYGDGVAEDLYASMDSGELDPNDVRGAEGMVRYMSGDDGSGVTEDRFNLALRSTLNLASGDLDSTMVVDFEGATEKARNASDDGSVTYDYNNVNETYEGLLFSSETPDGGFEKGTEYNVSNFNGTMSMLYDGGSSEATFYRGNFTITEIYDGDGNAVNQTDWSDPTYDEYNASEFVAALEDASEQRAQITADDSSGGDGDGPGPIFGGGDWLEGGGGGLLGLGIIGVVILAVFGIVTDAIPGLGNN